MALLSTIKEVGTYFREIYQGVASLVNGGVTGTITK